MGDEGKGTNTKKLTRRGTSQGRELQQIFQYFIWNAQFQKQRKEYLISLLKPKKKSFFKTITGEKS